MMGIGRSQRLKSRKKCGCSESESKSHDHEKKDIMKQKSNSKSCKVVSKLLLPEDLMIDILSRVPLKCLLNSARYVCKTWATTIGSSQFAEAYLHCAHSKPGLYVENWKSKSNSYFFDIKDDVNGLEKVVLGTPPRMGHIMSTCDGILLLHDGRKQFLVMNPILKCWLTIPPLPTLKLRLIHTVIIARVPCTTQFKLFFVDIAQVSGTEWYVFYVLRIGIHDSWKEIARKASLKTCFYWRPVCSGGNDLYWITLDAVIVIDVDKEIIVREYPYPSPLMDNGLPRTFLWMENRLACIMHKALNATYQIFILNNDSGKWTLYHEMGPFDYVAACGHELDISFVHHPLWINDQIIFQVDLHQRVNLPQSASFGSLPVFLKRVYFGYTVKTRQLAKIEGIAVGHFEVYSTSVAMLLTAVVSVFLFGFHLSLAFFLGTVVVSVAIYLHSAGKMQR